MPRRLRILSLLVPMLLLAATCGSSDNESVSGGDGSSLKGTTIEVAGVWSGAEQASFQKVLDAFEKDTGAKVRFTSTGDDIATVLGTRLEGGDPPDVAPLPQPGLLRDLVGRNALKPVDDATSKLVDDHYSKDWRDLGSVNGTLYGVWFKAANKSTVWYRPKAFTDAGVEVPKTWDDFVKTAETLRDAGETPIAIAGGDGWTLTDWFENVYLRVAGPQKYDQLAAHQIPWTDPTVVQALTTLGQLWGKKDLLAANSANMTFPESVTTVFRGDAAMVYEGDFAASNITDETDAKLGTDAKFFAFPSINGSDPSVVGAGDVAVTLTGSKGANELLQYLASPEAAEIWAARGGFTSPNNDVDLDRYADDVTRQSAKELVDAKTFRFDLSDLQPSAFGGTPSQGMWKILQDFLQRPTDPAATAQALESAAAAAYGK